MPDFGLAMPEFFLGCAAMALLMIGVYGNAKSSAGLNWAAVVAFLVTLALVVGQGGERVTGFDGQYVADAFSRLMKVLVLAGAAIATLMSHGYLAKARLDRYEFPVMLMLATLGMLLMISASNLITLYVGLELQSLSLYVLAAFRRESVKSTEAGLKYFVLGALSSGMLLYGASMVYGATGSLDFVVIAGAVKAAGGASVVVLIGIAFLVAGLCFKVSAVPFHMWTPDVYEGAPTPVTAFFSFTPKLAAFALLLRVMMEPFGAAAGQWQQIIVFISGASMVLGAFAAIGQTNIKRLMAYSSIGHVGYALVGLAAGTEDGLRGVIIYLAIYLVMSAGAFACILAMRRDDGPTEEIADLAGLSKTRPGVALALAVFMFSMAGVPPLAGFLGKFYVFLAAVHAGLWALSVVGVLASVVSAFYYIRIVKLMYFDEPAPAFEKPAGELSLVMGATGLLTLLLFIFPGPLLDQAAIAAKALLAI